MKDEKKKINYKERIGTGPFGVGKSEEVADTNIYEFTTATEQYSELTKDLTPEQLEHVEKETKIFADKYQNFFDVFSKLMADPKGKEAILKEFKKRTGAK